MPSSTFKATMIGFMAVMMWSTMATMVAYIAPLPLFEALLIAYIAAGACLITTWAVRGDLNRKRFFMPKRLWLMGIASLFGFHTSYYIGMREAPPVDVLLIINFWPLLMVLFSAFADRQPLRWWHIVGALTGFAGIVIITSNKGPFTFSPEFLLGYAAAFCCAVIWAAYSVICRKNSSLLPRGATGIFCVCSLPLALIMHFLAEPNVVNIDWHYIAVAAAVGVFPMALAYICWDYGIRQGDIRTIGTISYLGPLVGTSLLITFGFAAFSFKVVIAALLIIGGAFIGSMSMWRRKKQPETAA